MSDKTKSGDGGVVQVTAAGAADSSELDNFLEEFMASNAPANKHVPHKAAAIKKGLYKHFNVSSKSDKEKLLVALSAYFSMNIPAGRTDWSMANPMVFMGVEYDMAAVVGPIIVKGDAGVLKFLRECPKETRKALENAKLRGYLATRVAAAGLRPGQEMYTLPWCDDPSMDGATRVRARANLVSKRGDLQTESNDVARESHKTVAQGQTMWDA